MKNHQLQRSKVWNQKYFILSGKNLKSRTRKYGAHATCATRGGGPGALAIPSMPYKEIARRDIGIPECAKTYTDDNFRIIGQGRSSFHLSVLDSKPSLV